MSSPYLDRRLSDWRNVADMLDAILSRRRDLTHPEGAHIRQEPV